ncbi:MAG: rod shape-determining protein MreC [Deltaproteobacteria bacterium]|nr:MAG: rod shape-determining protein MreC [Deltaproteobacteria bacterium]
MNFFRRFRDAALVAALLAIPFFFLKANLTDPSRTSWLDRVVLQVSAPIQYAATEAAGGVSAIVEEYVWLVDVKADNEALTHDNARLRQRVRELGHEARENERMRSLLSLRDELPGETMTAAVIGKEVSPHFRVVRVRIDRGERDLLRPGMPVVSSEGLVGQIRRTWGRYSDVLLTVDRTSAIDVVIDRTGARGMLRGTGESDRYLCRIQYLQRTDEVEVGDEIYTSGLGQRFPSNILIGHVTRVMRQDFGLYQEVEVSPAVNFSAVEEVLILTAGSREQAVVEGLRDESLFGDRPR